MYVQTFLGESNSFLSFQKGDLIMLEQDSGEVVMNNGWCFGECARTGQRGDFSAENVYVLPTIMKLPQDILVCLGNLSKSKYMSISSCCGTSNMNCVYQFIICCIFYILS